MIRDIKIRAVLNGYLVNVGCQAVVFDDMNQLLKALANYLVDPIGMETLWRKSALNAKHFFDSGPVCTNQVDAGDCCEKASEPTHPYPAKCGPKESVGARLDYPQK